MTQPTQAQIEANLEQWDEWYKTLPPALKAKLSISDFRRLGDNFYRIFVLQKTATAQVGKPQIEAAKKLIYRFEHESMALHHIQRDWLVKEIATLIAAAIRKLKDAP